MSKRKGKKHPRFPLLEVILGIGVISLAWFITSQFLIPYKSNPPSPRPPMAKNWRSLPRAENWRGSNEIPKSTHRLPPPSNNLPSSPKPSPTYSARVAIVIDDVGYNLQLLREFLDLDAPLTFAVLPFLPSSSQSARLALAKGKSVILHMPMQAQKGSQNDPTFITVDLSPDEINRRIEEALRTVPGAKGVNNHMGSAATQKREIMDAVMSTLAKHDLFFLDSLTTPYSVAEESAQRMGIPFLKRDIFLDNEANAEYVVEKVRQLADLALRQGKAIGIGHLRETTLEGLKIALPYLREKKIEVVPLETLLEGR